MNVFFKNFANYRKYGDWSVVPLGFLGIGATLECFQTCGGCLHIMDKFSSLVIDGAIS